VTSSGEIPNALDAIAESVRKDEKERWGGVSLIEKVRGIFTRTVLDGENIISEY
jgi:hypothetical protein